MKMSIAFFVLSLLVGCRSNELKKQYAGEIIHGQLGSIAEFRENTEILIEQIIEGWQIFKITPEEVWFYNKERNVVVGSKEGTYFQEEPFGSEGLYISKINYTSGTVKVERRGSSIIITSPQHNNP